MLSLRSIQNNFIALSLVILPSFVWAVGGQGSGGGDPMSAQFVILAKQLAIFYKANP